MDTLNSEQKNAFLSVLSGYNTGVFGEAGSGKSHLLNVIIQSLEDKVTACAMTGVASHLLGAPTFHSVLHLGQSDGQDPEGMIATITSRSDYVNDLCGIQVLVVDEISMLSTKLFLAVDAMLQQVRGNLRPWGGIQLVFVGDWNQLQPVRGVSLLECDRFHSIFERKHHLVQNYRQQGHDDYQCLLRRVTLGRLTAEDHAALKARVGLPAPSNAVHIYGLKESVDRYNSERMDQLPGPAVQFTARFPAKISAAKITALLNASPVPRVLTLKAGARVMMVKNVNVDEGKVNGAFGTIVDPTVPTWTMDGTAFVETVESATWHLGDKRTSKDWMSSIPLVIAFASTVHKAQGLTLPCFVAQINPTQMFAVGHLYVLLSRVRSLNNVYLKSYATGCDRANESALTFYEMLRVHSQKVDDEDDMDCSP